ncbi:MAG: transporter [Myxococcales bacterium]|nr:transporter [Myxococcales bacterium]
MNAHRELNELLAKLKPQLLDGPFVFCTLDEQAMPAASNLQPRASVMEPEGLSVVLTEAQARDLGLPYEGVFRCITLTVQSSLEAVGLTAAVATALADDGIAANVIAGRHHDHLLVPQAQASEAMQTLRRLSASVR